MDLNWDWLSTLSDSAASALDDSGGGGAPKRSKSSSSELFALKQLQRLRPHFGAGGCSSMKFCTIFAKQTELGSNSVATSLLIFGNWRSKMNNRFSRDFNTDSFRTTTASFTFSESMSIAIGWTFIGAMRFFWYFFSESFYLFFFFSKNPQTLFNTHSSF